LTDSQRLSTLVLRRRDLLMNWQPEECYARQEGNLIHIGNKYVERVLSLEDDVLRSMAMINKITDRRWNLKGSTEARLTFATEAPRIEIARWRYRPATPDGVSADEDEGYRGGYHLPDFDDGPWRYVDCFTGVGESPRGDTDSVWPGYGWFRTSIVLPEPPEGRPLVLVFGGYDNEDWRYYRVFINGVEAGIRECEGRWRDPSPFRVEPGDEAYEALNYPGQNSIAVQAGGLDKRPTFRVKGEMEHYKFQSRLVDQYLTLGEPVKVIDDFRTVNRVVGGDRSLLWATFWTENKEEGLQVILHYLIRKGEPWIRKKIEVRNQTFMTRLLLDVEVESWQVKGDMTEGGLGLPIVLDNQAFCALEYPAGLNRGRKDSLDLSHFPGITLTGRQGFTSRKSLFGVTGEDEGYAGFREYLRSQGRRKNEWLSIYDPLGLVDTTLSTEPRYHYTEQIALDTVALLDGLRNRGVEFDYYIIDLGWHDDASDLTWFKPDEFPNGPGRLISSLRERSIKFGLWFSGSYAAWACGDYPPARASVVPRIGGPYDLCLASEPYRSILKEAVLYHIKENEVKAIKLDMARFYCNSTEHGHLPGKYSQEAQINSMIDMARSFTRACPELYIIWYWGYNSPFWLLYGDTLFDKGLLMEAAAVASSPNPKYRSATSHNLDQAVRYARFLPLTTQDSLGIWLGDVGWSNHMGKEDWREAWLLDIARGNMVSQLWGDFTLLDDGDAEFLSDWFTFLKVNGSLYSHTKPILGDPWKTEAYGYAAGDGSHTVVTIHNPSFETATADLKLDESTGLQSADSPLSVRLLYPEKAAVSGTYSKGDTLQVPLRAFEVMILEIAPGLDTRGWAVRKDRDPVESIRVSVDWESPSRPAVSPPSTERTSTGGYELQHRTGRLDLPAEGEQNALAVVLRLSKSGEHWYHKEICNLGNLSAKIEGQELPYRKAPQHYTRNGPGSPWLLFDLPVSVAARGKALDLELAVLLPKDVEWQVESWLYARWWV
jgi:hypothetical protein